MGCRVTVSPCDGRRRGRSGHFRAGQVHGESAGGIAFSLFRGYEAWQVISISRNERVAVVILGNPVMIDAYRAGIPGNGKPVPDGAKMAKVHWTAKQNAFFPDATVPGRLVNVAVNPLSARNV